MKTNARHLILNLLLGAAGQRLSAREAVAACALFGIRDNSARVALARLVAAGLVEVLDRGAYGLGPNAASLAAEVAGWRDTHATLRDWGGGWVAVHVGETDRGDRAALRTRMRALELLGMRELERGLHLRPDNLAGGVKAVRTRLHKLGLASATAVFGVHEFDAATQRSAAALWDGGALDRGYRATRSRLDAWSAQADALDIQAAARGAFVLGNTAIRQLVFDPLLPAPLVDAEARRDFVSAVIRFDAAGHAIWQRFLSGVARPSARATRSAPSLVLETTP